MPRPPEKSDNRGPLAKRAPSSITLMVCSSRPNLTLCTAAAQCLAPAQVTGSAPDVLQYAWIERSVGQPRRVAMIAYRTVTRHIASLNDSRLAPRRRVQRSALPHYKTMVYIDSPGRLALDAPIYIKNSKNQEPVYGAQYLLFVGPCMMLWGTLSFPSFIAAKKNLS